MLQSLCIQNYALINELEINFNRGLNIITGETGAGKSILLGALSLILGQRADTSVLKDKSKKCFVEAEFSIDRYNIKDFFVSNDIDYDNATTIRREIANNGKSRAFINDTPVNLSVLKSLSAKLIDIHSQHENLLLGVDTFQLELVDSFANHQQILDQYKTKLEKYSTLNSEYRSLINNADKAKSDLDYLQFQFKQLDELNLVEGEQVELEAELEQLTHAEEIKINLTKSSNLFSGEEIAVISNLKEIKNNIDTVSKYIKQGEELSNRIQSTYIELQDINSEIERINEHIEHNPERMELVNDRLNNIYSLQQKHKLSTVEELIALKDEFDQKINLINSYDFETDKLKATLDKLKVELLDIAQKISTGREKVIPMIEKRIVEQLQLLGIKNASFKVNQEPVDEFLPTGTEYIQFLFSANKNTSLEELSKVASGGEMSRLMLSIKALFVETTTLPTIIFDEIDTGTSGEIADKMGAIIKQISGNIQVINITHLPQIASKGDYHYLVYKEDNSDTTNTHIKILNKNERINEIAKMLSGEDLSDAAILNAKVLLEK